MLMYGWRRYLDFELVEVLHPIETLLLLRRGSIVWIEALLLGWSYLGSLGYGLRHRSGLLHVCSLGVRT